ncbi:hypothetical protein BZG01_20565 [Labilibaculum manganireducens]|uniref:Uncharacterized protein n=1 Tax=Labilibaculum manganireducens TaxID=1940525 RepID=A0A2N3HRR4_9BACT|nr:hypothetical protein [Labilibaculum manganireducens]PKQ60732.1 hypothetical protein BZG01_20565 [Labilibaculum manganireducens]
MIEYTLDWYNGEIFEGKFILGFGVFLLISAVLFHIYGNLPSAKALLIPLIVIGLFFTSIGVGGIYSNSKKVAKVEEIYLQNQGEFVDSEIARVEGFQYLYPMSIGISLTSFLIAIGLLYFVKNVQWQAIAIALILLGSAFAAIDYFSKERARIYYEKLISE